VLDCFLLGNGNGRIFLTQVVFSFNSHTAAIAARNNGIPVRMHGHEFGKASCMAQRAR
jgi:hypothetical protein